MSRRTCTDLLHNYRMSVTLPGRPHPGGVRLLVLRVGETGFLFRIGLPAHRDPDGWGVGIGGPCPSPFDRGKTGLPSLQPCRPRQAVIPIPRNNCASRQTRQSCLRHFGFGIDLLPSIEMLGYFRAVPTGTNDGDARMNTGSRIRPRSYAAARIGPALALGVRMSVGSRRRL